jgi:hypothetical protein
MLVAVWYSSVSASRTRDPLMRYGQQQAKQGAISAEQLARLRKLIAAAKANTTPLLQVPEGIVAGGPAGCPPPGCGGGPGGQDDQRGSLMARSEPSREGAQELGGQAMMVVDVVQGTPDWRQARGQPWRLPGDTAGLLASPLHGHENCKRAISDALQLVIVDGVARAPLP